ncbi:alpha/beta fold hydrolase [Paralcaligenes ginsengisoli]
MNYTQHRIISVNGINMHIAEQGNGPLILLCHGFPETSYSWRHQLKELAAAGFHAVAPDMRGYGKTDSPAEIESFNVCEIVADIVGLLDALGEEKAVIVGNDWGATVAWQAALRQPQRFRGVVALGVPMMQRAPVASSSFFPKTDDEELYALYFQTPGVAEAELDVNVKETLLKILFAASGEAGPRLPNDGTPNPFGMVSRSEGLLSALPIPDQLPPWLTQDDLAIFAESFEFSGFRGGLNYYRNLDRNWELEAAMAGIPITIPALYLVGERDTGLSIPGMKEIIASMPSLVTDLRGSIVVRDCGHWLPQERPSILTDSIIDFANSL